MRPGGSRRGAGRDAGYAYLLLGKLIEREPDTGTSEDVIGRAAEFIENNYADQLSVDDIAGYAGVSRSWLYRGFMQRFGRSPAAYLRDTRLAYACQLLRDTDLRVTEVANSVGYPDALYFSKVFAGKMGSAPTQYRLSTRK